MELAELVARLADTKKTTAGYEARCPAHEDSHASLSVAAGVKGVVIKCHAGCAASAVMSALGLKTGDLFSANATQVRSRIVAEYDYLDASGIMVFQVVRFSPKDFRQRRPAVNGEPSKGGWVWSLKGTTPVLFGLPSILVAASRHERIYVVEGEKDALALRGLGVTATSAPMGAGAKWLPSYSESLRGAYEVVVVPDKDEMGMAHATKILAALNVAGIPARSLILPGEGKDAHDWVAAGGNAVALQILSDGPAPTLRPATVGDRPGPAPLRGLGKNLESACRIMRDDTARGLALWPGPAGYNVMTERVECDGKPIYDHHITHARERIADGYSMPGGGTPLRLTGEQVREALELVAHEREFHPVEDWLRALPSAGAGHIECIARRGLGLTDDREVGLVRRWFIAAAARALRPGCQADSALVLCGQQGVYKTSFFRALAGPWYGSGPVRPDDKDTLARLHRSWIYEWAELAAMNKRSLEELRDFMTTTRDFWRPAYGRSVVERPRRAVFAGSTNVSDFLQDQTGNRRFWPLMVTSTIDISTATELREPAFAEARDALAAGEQWWLTAAEAVVQAEATAEFEHVDVWQDIVAEWIEAQAAFGRNCFSAMEILRYAVKCDPDKVGAGEAHRVADIMRRLGWINERLRVRGPQARYWHQGKDSVDLTCLPDGYKGGQ